MEALFFLLIGAIIAIIVGIYCDEREYSSLEKDGMLARMYLYFLATNFVSAFILSFFAS